MDLKVCFFLLVFLCSCTGNTDSLTFETVQDYRNYHEDASHGQILRYSNDFVHYSIMVMKPLEGDEVLTVKLNLMPVDKNGTVNPFNDTKLQNILDFGLLESFELRGENNLVIGAQMYHLERNYGLKPGLNLFVDFPLDEIKQKDVRFYFWDQFIGNEIVDIKIENNLITPCHVKE